MDKSARTTTRESTDLALLRQEVQYMGTDLKEIKAELQDFKSFYQTREQAANLKREMEASMAALSLKVQGQKDRIDTAYRYGSIVLGLIITALGGAILRLIIKQ